MTTASSEEGAFDDFLHHKLFNEWEVYQILLVCLLIVAFYLLFKVTYRRVKGAELARLSREVVTRRNQRKFQFEISNVDVDQILSMDVTQMREELFKGTFTSVDLVNVFGERCQRIGRALNLSTEENFNAALKMAAERDTELAVAKEKGEEELAKLGPLHGIPFSVKDSIDIKGKASSLGCAYLLNERARDDSSVVKLLMKAGGIPLVKGNVPQTAIGQHTANSVYGEARNPLKQERSCGGSSGGDAGLVASRCTPISFGTDLGGSIRIPAAFCGIFGLKPTSGRMPKRGINPCRKIRFNKFNHMMEVVGPMGCSVDDLVIGTKVLLDKDVYLLDPLVTPTPWKQEEFQMVQDDQNLGEIKIGVLAESPHLPISAGVKRAMLLAEEALRELGYKVEPFMFEDETWRLQRDFYMGMLANGYSKKYVEDLEAECETLIKLVQQQASLLNKTFVGRAFTDFLMKMVQNNRRIFVQLNGFRTKSRPDYEAFMKMRFDFVHQMADKWKRAGLTALLSPIWPNCAFKASSAMETNWMLDYALISSVVGFPSGVLPITQVQPEEQNYSDHFKDRWSAALNQDAQNSIDMPLGVQIIGYAFEDEKVLGIMKKVAEKVDHKVAMPPVIESDLGLGQAFMNNQ